MTIAVCFRCGAFKNGALVLCSKCGADPTTKEDRALSLALSDHHYEKKSLERYAVFIKAGKSPPVSPHLVEELKESLTSEVAKRISAIFPDLTENRDDLTHRNPPPSLASN